MVCAARPVAQALLLGAAALVLLPAATGLVIDEHAHGPGSASSKMRTSHPPARELALAAAFLPDQPQHASPGGHLALVLDSTVPNDNADLQAFANQVHDRHTAWVERTSGGAGRRRVQEEDGSGREAVRARLSFSADAGPVTGRRDDGSFMHGDESLENGALRYQHLRNTFSSSACNDPLAENHGAADTACTYSCGALQAYYFPAASSRCFAFSPADGRWVETVAGSLPDRREHIGFLNPDGAGDDLLELKRTSLDWHNFLLPTAADETTFTTGDGRSCRNVTIETTSITDGGLHERWSTEEHCLLDGIHEYNHTIHAGSHALEVVGYTENTTHAGPDGLTSFAVGQCTDVIIRLTTTRPTNDGQGLAWRLDDSHEGESHNGPWQFAFPGGVSTSGTAGDCADLECSWFAGSYTIQTCMFDNEFTITRQGGEGWEGSIEVLSVVDDATIYIPVDENWIIQGVNSNDLPVLLDARLSSGYRQRPEPGVFPTSTTQPNDAAYLSHANIVIRSVRISGQTATLDKFYTARTMSTRTIGDDPACRLGGAFFYEGFGSELIFDRSVFDHNLATGGGALMVDGRWEEQRRDTTERDVAPRPTTVKIFNCFFYENAATWMGGALRHNDIFPFVLNITDSVMADNQGFIGNTFGGAIYNLVPDCSEPECTVDGSSRMESHRVHHEGYRHANLVSENTITIFSGVKATAGSGYTFLQNNCTTAGQTSWALSAWMVFDPNDNPDGTLVDTQVLQDGVIKDCATYGGVFGVVGFQSDIFQADRMKFENNVGEQASSQAGAVRIIATMSSSMSHVQFIGNRAGLGGAVLLGGSASHQITSSVFDGNIAQIQGGAITFQVAAALNLLIESSVFVANLVQLTGDNAFSDVTFRIFTANTGIGGTANKNSDALSAVLPIWFIGPIDNGVDATGRQHLPQHEDGSVEDMQQALSGDTCVRGACPDGTPCCDPEIDDACPAPCGVFTVHGSPEEWPGDSAHTPLRSDTTYASVVRLASGWHRLWHGSIISTSDGWHSNWDNGGWLDVVGILDKVYPQVCDNRAVPCPTDEWEQYYDAASSDFVRHPGCYASTDDGCDASCSIWPQPADSSCIRSTPFCCWIGMSYWSYTDFEVPYGVGGAVNAATGGAVIIRDSRFDMNYAGTGAAVSVVNAEVEITTTSFAMSTGSRAPDYTSEQDHVDVAAARLLTCETMPCGMGEQCRFDGVSRFCAPCGVNEIGDGIVCSSCQPGTEPDEDHINCMPCPSGQYSVLGICQNCAAGTSTGSSTGGVNCDTCPRGTTSAMGGECLACVNGTVSDRGTPCTSCVAGTEPGPNFGSCVECQLGTFSIGDECRTCEQGMKPNEQHTGCQTCAILGPAFYSSDGERCVECPSGSEPDSARATCRDCLSGRAAAAGALCEPCSPGQRPSADSTSCEDCPSGTFSLGIDCESCAPGFQPDEAQTSCQSCSTLGPTFYSPLGDECVECPALMRADNDWTGCVCKEDTYDVFKHGALRCDDADSTSMGELQCMPCLSCLECSEEGEALRLKPGFALYGRDTAYKCPVFDGCIGAPILNLSSAREAWVPNADSYFDETTMRAQCAEGYAGPICAKCGKEYNHLTVGKVRIPVRLPREPLNQV